MFRGTAVRLVALPHSRWSAQPPPLPRTPRSRLPPPAPAAAPADPRPSSPPSTASRSPRPTSTLAHGDLDQQFAQLPPEQRRAAALSAIIEIRLLAAKAVANGLDKAPDFQRRMAFLQQRALHSELVEKDVVDKITDAEVRARYDKEIANTPPVNEVHARHILVKTKEEADDDHQAARRRRQVRRLANEHTSDPAARRRAAISAGSDPARWCRSSRRRPSRSRSAPTPRSRCRSQFGWHVIKVEDKRAQQPPAFDKVKDQVRSVLLREKYFALVKSVRAGAKVDIADPELKKGVEQVEKSQ